MVGGDLQHPVLAEIIDGKLQFVVGICYFAAMPEQDVGFSGGDDAGSAALEQREPQLLLQAADRFT